MSQDINVGFLAEEINNKADIDLRNVDVSKTDIVIEYQEPDASNNYTWYRLYASGWVEQGGIIAKVADGSQGEVTINFPITMIDTNYNWVISYGLNQISTTTFRDISAFNKTVISFKARNSTEDKCWQVSGKADMTGHEVLPSKKEKDENDHRVVVFQKPTADNNYTWYRKYADGWVEQGGISDTIPGAGGVTVTLPIKMADTKYTISGIADSPTDGSANNFGGTFFNSATVSNFVIDFGNASYTGKTRWKVEGMYATE